MGRPRRRHWGEHVHVHACTLVSGMPDAAVQHIVLANNVAHYLFTAGERRHDGRVYGLKQVQGRVCCRPVPLTV